MKKRKCALFLFNGYADWEPSLIISGLNKFSDFFIESFSVNPMVTSMGGLHIQPDRLLAAVDGSSIDLLILPGGDAWEGGHNTEILPLIQETLRGGKMIAAICAATTLLAQHGFLDDMEHTSNGLEYLKKWCPNYKGESHYVHRPCVVTENIITANGAAMIEFAHEIYKTFQVFNDQTVQAIYDLYKSGGMDNRLYA